MKLFKCIGTSNDRICTSPLRTSFNLNWMMFLFWISLSVGCQNIPANNPYDPKAPDVLQAPGSITGEIITSESKGNLSGGVVNLVGTSYSSVLNCLEEMDIYCFLNLLIQSIV